MEVSGKLEVPVEIFPDYKEVTIPSNIAPMNFEVIDHAGRNWALKITAGDTLCVQTGRSFSSESVSGQD